MFETETIGNATLYRADCREVLPTLGEVDALVSDPPYGMAYQSGRRAQRYEKIKGDEGENLLKWACEMPVRHSRYVFCRWDNLVSVPRPASCITWIKDNHSSGDLKHEHGRQYESILFYPGSQHFFPRGRPNDVIKCPRVSGSVHPTQKPAGLMMAVIDWTDGVILDPFMGSGSTGVAAQKRGRKFIGIELEKKYFDIACERISEASAQGDLLLA